jgi:hypothetical protein
MLNIGHFVGGAISGYWFHRIWHHEAFAEDTSKREEKLWPWPCLKFWFISSPGGQQVEQRLLPRLGNAVWSCKPMKQPCPHLWHLVLIVSRNSYFDIFFHSNFSYSFAFRIWCVYLIDRVSYWLNIWWHDYRRLVLTISPSLLAFYLSSPCIGKQLLW